MGGGAYVAGEVADVAVLEDDCRNDGMVIAVTTGKWVHSRGPGKTTVHYVMSSDSVSACHRTA